MVREKGERRLRDFIKVSQEPHQFSSSAKNPQKRFNFLWLETVTWEARKGVKVYFQGQIGQCMRRATIITIWQRCQINHRMRRATIIAIWSGLDRMRRATISYVVRVQIGHRHPPSSLGRKRRSRRKRESGSCFGHDGTCISLSKLGISLSFLSTLTPNHALFFFAYLFFQSVLLLNLIVLPCNMHNTILMFRGLILPSRGYMNMVK